MCNYCINDNYCYAKHNTNIHTSEFNLFGSEFISIANDFEWGNYGNMVTFFRQYGDNDLYFYANRGSMCNNGINDNYGYSKHDANIHTSEFDLFGSEFIGIANNFEWWNNRNVVASFRQYCNNNVCIYTNNGSMCYCCNDDNFCRFIDITNIHASSVNLFWSDFIGIANDFK